jgi:hypothetical protein
MARNDGRVEKGQSIRSAFSAKAWNRAQDAADIVLGVQPSTAVGSLRESSHYLAKTTSQWAKGTSQTLTLWGGTPGSEAQLSDQVVAWNKFAAVASGKWVMLARANATFYLVAAEC